MNQMTIIASTDKSDYKNDKTYRSITLAEQFGLYMIITIEYKPGLFGRKKVRIIKKMRNYNRAVRSYIEYGGAMRREF